ncbi:MAG TPA: VWA domain-containing protein [Vicinamibacterales bacterium]
MTRLFVAAFVLAAAVQQAPQAPSASAPQAPVIIDAVVTDASGMPVTDLTAKDLEVWIGGYRVPITTLTAVTPANERAARSIVLILDDVTLPPALMPRVREVAKRFVDRMLPGDSIAITFFGGGEGEMSQDRARLFKIIDDYNIRATGVQRVDYYGEQVLRMASTISRNLMEPADRRKTIVAIGPSGLFDTPIPPPQLGRELRKEWVDAMRAMAFSNVTFYVIEPAGLGATPLLSKEGGFSRETGGLSFMNINDFNGAVDTILREASSYYIIEVPDPPIRRGADLRELDVKVLRPGLKARARRALPGTR